MERRDEVPSDPRLSQPRREPINYYRQLRAAESRIAQLTDELASSNKRAAENVKRADEAEVARDKSEIEQERILDELCALNNAFKELQKTGAAELAALEQQYIAVLATASEKTNRAKEAMEEGDVMRERMEEMIREGVKKAVTVLEEEKADLKASREELMIKLEESEKARVTLCNSLMDAQEMLNGKTERDYFERLSQIGKELENSPAVDLLSIRPHSRSSRTSETITVTSRISPPLGVDPFALLNSCEGARKKLSGDIFARFKKLSVLFDRCDKRRLVQQTFAVVNKQETARCALCRVSLVSASSVLQHICGRRHIEKMNGVVCADAYYFWWNAVEKAGNEDRRDSRERIPQLERRLRDLKEENAGLRKEMERYKRQLGVYEAENREDVGKLLEKYKSRNKDCERLKKELEEAEERMGRMEKKKDAFLKELKEAEEKSEKLRKERTEMKEELEKAKAEVDEGKIVKRERNDLKRQLESLQFMPHQAMSRPASRWDADEGEEVSRKRARNISTKQEEVDDEDEKAEATYSHSHTSSEATSLPFFPRELTTKADDQSREGIL